MIGHVVALSLVSRALFIHVQVYNLPPPPPELQKAYEAMDSLPASVLQQVIVPTTENDAASMVQVFLGEDRVGPANTHRFDPNSLLKQALLGPDAVPSLPSDDDDDAVPSPSSDADVGPDRQGECRSKRPCA